MSKTNEKNSKYKLGTKVYIVIITILLILATSPMWFSDKYISYLNNEKQKITLKSEIVKPLPTTPITTSINLTTDDKTHIPDLAIFLAIIDIQQALNNNLPYIEPLTIVELGMVLTNPELNQAINVLKPYANSRLESFDQLLLELHGLQKIPKSPTEGWIKKFITINKVQNETDLSVMSNMEEKLLNHNYEEAISLATQYDYQDSKWLQWVEKLKTVITAHNSIKILFNHYRTLLYKQI